MTLFFQNHQITIYRRRRKGSTDRYGMSATFTAYWSDIQPAGLDRTTFVGGRVGSVYTAFVDTTADVKEGDEIHIIGGTYNNKVFSVKGVNHWENAGLLDHTELTMVAQDG